MRALGVLTLLCVLCTLSECANAFPRSKFEKKHWTRDDAIACAERNAIDLNADGRFDYNEVKITRALFLGTLKNFGAAVIETVGEIFEKANGESNKFTEYTVEHIMQHCGDGDGFITKASFQATKDKCLNNDVKVSQFMDLCIAHDKKN
jgi:hypothetical protein